MKQSSTMPFGEIAGLDLGDKYSRLCVLDAVSGAVIEESRVSTTPKALQRRFSSCAPMRIAIEVGTHSPWVSRLLNSCGHEVIVANARKVRLIWESRNKNDKIDAEILARLARFDPKLLAPIEHRRERGQCALAILRSREALVGARTKLINHARGSCKAMGCRLPKWSAGTFAGKANGIIPQSLAPALTPVLETIAKLTVQIRGYDRQIEEVAQNSFPEAKILRQVGGVGPLTSLAYVLVVEDPRRFDHSRSVGPYLGLVPRRDASGESDPQLRITKEGDEFLRKLLINSAHYILGPFGADCDLRRHGLRIAARGGKNAKKRAAVAVARKLSILLHVLWKKAAVYEPLHNSNRITRSEVVA